MVLPLYIRSLCSGSICVIGIEQTRLLQEGERGLRKKTILFAAACALLLAFSITALGENAPLPTAEATEAPVAVTNPDISMEVELGYAGSITYMRDIPFTVTVENTGPDMEGTIAVDLYRNNRFFDRYEYPVALASGAKKRVVMPVNLKMKQDRYVIELSQGGEVLASVIKTPDRIIRPEAVLIGVLSADPQSLSYMNLDALTRVWADRYEAWQLVALDADDFPQNDSLMSAFTLLVVDGFDAAALSGAQQSALDRWISGGGIVVVGGGAQASAGYPYFSKYTALTAGALAETEDITPALIQHFAYSNDKPLGQPVLLNDVSTDAEPLLSSSRPLIYQHQAGSGLIYTATFDLGAKPLANWSGMSSLWPRVLLKSGNRQYTAMYNQISGRMYGGSYNTYMLGNVPIESSGSTVPVIILLFVYLIASGLGSYLLLKRLDKREWMWLTAPVLAFLCMAGLYGLSQSLPFNKPAAASFTTIRMNAQGESLISSIAGISSPETGEVQVRGEEGTRLSPIDENTYFYEDPYAATAPKELMYRVVLGDTPIVGFSASSPWALRHVVLTGEKPSFGKVSGRLWMEEDGMHGEIVNDTPYTFKDGLLLTNLGYARVSELKSGAAGRVTLLRPANDGEAVPSATSSARLPGGGISIYEAKIEEGVMISSSIIRPNDMDLYPIVRAAVFPEEQSGTTTNFRDTMSRDELALRTFRESAIQQATSMNLSGSAAWISPFHFVAFQEEIGQTKLYINGGEVKKHGHQAVVDVLLAYEPVGPTGIVYYPIGTLPAYPVKLNEDGTIAEPDEKPADVYMAYQLALHPAFCFKLPDITQFSVASVSLLATSYDTVPTMQLYNHQTQMWEEQSAMFVSFTEKGAQSFIGPEGRLYVRFLPGSGSRDYDSVMAPSISLEGRRD